MQQNTSPAEIALEPQSQQRRTCPYQLCKESCVCGAMEINFTPQDCDQIIYKGIIANNPNNPGFNLKEGSIRYNHIESIPIAEICKIKLCYRNQFMLINTLQIYSSHNESKPICLGVNQSEGSEWFLKVIQAKLVQKDRIRIVDSRPVQPLVTGTLFKKATFGKRRRHQATCSTIPPRYLKLSDEYSNINSTSEIWSRFQLDHEQGILCLIVKLWGALGKKQLAIPIPQLALWVRSLCSLLS